MEQVSLRALWRFFGWIFDRLGPQIALGITLLILLAIGIAFRFLPLIKLAYWLCLLKGPDLAARLGITGLLGNKYRKRAMRLLQRRPESALRLLDEAIHLLETAYSGDSTSLKLHNSLVDSYNVRGEIRLDSKDWSNAASDFKRVIDLQPSNMPLDETYVRRAEAMFNSNDLPGAVELLRSADQKFPQSVVVQRALCICLPQLRDEMYDKKAWEDVIKECDDLIRLCANDPAVLATSYFYSADAKRLQGNYKGAIADAAKLLEYPSEKGKGYLLRGLAKLGQQRFAEAVADLTKAIDDPDIGYKKLANVAGSIDLAHMNRASARLMSSDYEGAVEDYTLLIEKSARQEILYYEGRAEAYYWLQQYDKALQDLTQAIDLGSRNAETYFLRGEVHRLLGYMDQALADFQEGGSLEPEEHHWGDYGCGLVFQQESQSIAEDHPSEKKEALNQARKYFRNALDKSKRREQEFSDLYRRLAEVESKLGNYREAMRLRERARTLEHGAGITVDQLPISDLWEPVQEVLKVQDVKEVPDFETTLEEFEERIKNKPNDPDAHYGAGLLYFKAAKTGKSIQHFTKVIELNPNFADAYYWRGFARVQDKNWQGAISDANKALGLSPQMADAYRLRGIGYSNLNKLDEAAESFSKAIECDPKLVEAYHSLAWIRAQEREWEKVLEETGRAANQGASHVDIYSIRAYANWMLGMPDQAILECNKALDLKEDHAPAYRLRGLAFLQLGKFDEAIGDLDRAINLNDKDAEAYGGRGEVYRLKLESNQGLRDLDRAIELSPQFARAYYNRGWTRIQIWEQSKDEADLNQVLADFNELTRLAKEHPAGYWSLGECYRLKGQLDEALAQLRRAINRDQNSPLAYQIRAWVYYQKGQWDVAFGDFSEALDLGSPDLKNLYYGRGECERMRKKWDAAIRDYTEAIKRDPKFALVYHMRGRARAGNHEWRGAIEDYTQATRNGIETAEIFTDRAWAYHQSERDLESVEDIKSALDLDPKSVYAYNVWGIVLGRLGQLEEAIVKFSKVIELDPKSSLGYSNRGWARCSRGELQEAAEDLTTAVELDDKDANAFDNRAWARLLKGELDAALQDCEKTLELDQTQPFAYSKRALIKLLKGESSQALEDLKKVLEIRLSNYALRVPERDRGDSVNWGAGSQYWGRAVESNPDDPVAYFGRAITQWMAGELETAIDDLDKAIALGLELTDAARIRDLVIREKEDLVSREKSASNDPGERSIL